MIVELEVGVLHPHGVMDPERHPHHTPAQRRDEVDALFDDGAQAIDVASWTVVTGGGRRRVEDHDRPDVHVHGGGLQRQERGVHAAQTFHHRVSERRRCGGDRDSSTGVAEATQTPGGVREAAPSAISTNLASSTAWMTSWAIRSPRWTS